MIQRFVLTRFIQDSENSIDFVQSPPGSRRERVNTIIQISFNVFKLQIKTYLNLRSLKSNPLLLHNKINSYVDQKANINTLLLLEIKKHSHICS